MLREMPSIGIAAVRAGFCPQGHDLAAPDAVAHFSRVYRCMPCWREARGPKLCKAGEHPLAGGQRRCAACLRDKHEGPKDMSYLFVGMPPSAVLEGAACGPSVAHLFDTPGLEAGHGGAAETGARGRTDALAAMTLCGRCPVRAACFADALEWRREGVWGGAYFTQRWHQASRSALRNGTAQPPLRDLAYYAPRSERAARAVRAAATLGTVDTVGIGA